jgi:hypothetical protein
MAISRRQSYYRSVGFLLEQLEGKDTLFVMLVKGYLSPNIIRPLRFRG